LTYGLTPNITPPGAVGKCYLKIFIYQTMSRCNLGKKQWIIGKSHQQGQGYPLLGILNNGYFHDQGGLSDSRELSSTGKRSHLAHNLEDQTLAKGFYLSLAPGTE
jgi:hypothetical protein